MAPSDTAVCSFCWPTCCCSRLDELLSLAIFLLEPRDLGREACAQRLDRAVTQLPRGLLRADAEVAFALARVGQQLQRGRGEQLQRL